MSLIRITVFAVVTPMLLAFTIEAQEQEASPAAEVVFDVSIKALLQSPEFKDASIEDLIHLDSDNSPFGSEFGISDITRVSGAISLPKRIGDLAKVFYEKEFPFDFMFQIRFSKNTFVERFSDYLKSQNFQSENVGGVLMTRVPVTDTKTSVLVRKYGPSTLAIGTAKFLSGNINDVVTLEARKSWANCAKGPVRLVFDLKNSSSFVDEIFQLVDFEDAQSQLEKVSQQANAFSVSLLPDSGGLVQIGVAASSTESTAVLKKRLDFLSFELRTTLNRFLKPLSEERDEEPLAIDGISTVANQSEIKLLVAKPTDLPYMLVKALDSADEESKTIQTQENQPEEQLTQR